MRDVAEVFAAISQVVEGQLSLETAITTYENAMRPRGVRDVELSLETAKKMHISYIMDSPFLKMGFHKQDTWNTDREDKD